MDATSIGEISEAWADLGPTPPSPSSGLQSRPSAKAAEIIGKLGLRYPPANSVDRDSHAARVALLAQDCADIPDEWLDVVATRWAKTQPFFPRTCELRDDALSYGRSLTPALPAPQPKIAPYNQQDIQDRDRSKFTSADWTELNDRLELLGSQARYRTDGTRYTLNA